MNETSLLRRLAYGMPWVWEFPWAWVWDSYGYCIEFPWVLWELCGNF